MAKDYHKPLILFSMTARISGSCAPAPAVRFAPDAQDHFDRWRAEIEARCLALGESALAAYTAKTPAAGARMALIVHFLERRVVAEG